MNCVGKTDIGLIRKVNEDSYACFVLEKEILLGIVADGMGGHFAGEVASQIAVEETTRIIKKKVQQQREESLSSLSDNGIFDVKMMALIKEAIENANRKIYSESLQNSEWQGMGTTLSMALALQNRLFIGHVGDSRIYRINEKGISKLTEDHSLVAELVKNGTIKPEEANHHPQKNIITKALGTEHEIEADILSTEILDKDIILICSDGLSNMVQDCDLKSIIDNASCIENACEQLISKAKENGGFDNITVIIMQIIRGGDCGDR